VLLERTTLVRAPLASVFDFFSDPRNLARLTPPAMRFRIVEAPDRKLRAGDRMRYTIRLLGIPVGWTTLITSWDEGRSFSDVQERGPYRSWTHTHAFAAVGDGVRMRDRIEYELPFGVLGRIAHAFWVGPQLRRIFDYRERAIREVFDGPGPPG
jgi:ligand-binding SRPBCC domain-containing protein